jgi:FkbM family methyltransferase
VLERLRQYAFRWWDFVRRGTEIRRLSRRVHILEEKARQSREKWQRGEKQSAALKRQSASRRRRILSPGIVHGLLPMRLATIRARASRANASASEAHLAQVSTAYAQALAAIPHVADNLVRTDLQGLTWWVPVPPSLIGAARDRLLAKQRFPYRNITQAREFAIGPILLDIGANTGRMSIPRVILGDIAQAFCAEPDPLNYAALVRNVVDNRLSGLVLPDNVAIGAATGTAKLQHAKYPGGHHLVPDASTASAVSVPCWRLDDWCERLSIDPDLVAYIKVDTQGWEVQVLRGAPRLLGYRHIAWQLEVSPDLLAAAGNSDVELYAICAERFSHFVDLGKKAEGSRARSVRELAEALGYLGNGTPQTDIVLFSAADRLLEAEDENG